jgi:hypothetical protein
VCSLQGIVDGFSPAMLAGVWCSTNNPSPLPPLASHSRSIFHNRTLGSGAAHINTSLAVHRALQISSFSSFRQDASSSAASRCSNSVAA